MKKNKSIITITITITNTHYLDIFLFKNTKR